MKTKLAIIYLLAAIVLVACNKDKFTTKPQVKIKSISPGEVVQGDIIQLKGSFTDQEGDIDSVLIVYKWYDGNTANRSDTFRYSIEGLNIPNNTREADVFITFSYGRQIDGLVPLTPTPSIRDTTGALGLVLIDKAENRSDYAESDRILLRRF